MYTFVTTSANGCDSTATLNLTINLPDGCTDSTQLNYDANATCDDGSCIPFTYGCTDSTAFNYDPLANTDDGSCVAVLLGCTDATATNYDATANTDDGTCTFFNTILGCTDSLAFNYDPLANTDDGSCVYLGCTDITSCNYDPTATVDDGTCIYSSTSLSNIQSCDTYAWNGQNYSTSGVYTFVTTSSNGCDSTATLNLTINLSTISTSSAISCDTYTWNGSTYSASGSYDYLTLNADGCDSTATLNLTINGSTTSSVSVTECDTYTWNGSTYSASGSYDYLTVNAVGCDSIATLNLTINGSTTSTTDVTIPNTYTWNGVAYTSSGVYTYSTLNAVGCDSTATLNLTILTCDAPLNPLTHTILLDRATMTWDAVADADHYEIRFKQLGSTSWQYINEYSTSRTKTNLSSATSYHWQVRTHCDASAFNISEWTDTIVFQTMTPCANTTNLSDSIVGLDFATLTWDNDPNVWAYRVRYRKTGAWIFDTTYTNTITLSGLDNSSVYNWQVKSMCDPNAVNSATWTSNHQFTTLTPCDDPSVLLVDSVGINEAYLSWTAPSGTDHFVVLYSELGSGVWNSTTTANTNIALTGLATYAPYEWSLLAFCEASGLNNSDTILGNNFVTANPCTPPTGMFSSNVLLDRFTMNWNAVALADHYEIRFKEQGSAIWQMITNITNTNNTKTNLTAGNTYEWEVRSICDASGTSYSDWSATQTQATLTPCVTPLNPASANVTLTTADLSWDNDPSVWGYSVRYRISGTWIFDTTYTNTITLSGLYNSSLYNWQVKAMCDPNGNNSSPWTSNQTFNTITACSTPFNLAVNQIGLTSVKFVMSGPNSPDHYYVLYRASGATSWDTITLSGADISGNYATKIVTGLTSATTYEWQAQASCQADDSNLSAFAIGNNFTTLTCDAPLNPLTHTILLDRATMTWDAVADADHYEIRFKQLGSTSWQYINEYSTSRTKTNLSSATSYHWQVRTHCDASAFNISEWTDTIVFQTMTPCANTTNLSDSIVGLDFATLTWDNDPNVWAYRVRYRKTGAWIFDTTYTNTITLSGLDNSSVYNWQVKSMCDPNAVNSATWTSNHQFTTLTPCDDPSVLLVDSVGINEAYLSWTAPSGTDHFVVLYSELGSGVWNSTTTANTNIALTGLATYAPYEWSLLAFCEASGLNNSDTILGNNFVTANPCTPPTGMFSSNVLLDRFTMNWNAVALADHYEIRFKEQGSAIWQMITNITNTNNTKTNLTAGNTYEWEVRSICDASGTSYSDWSATQTQATLTPCVTPLNPASANVTLTTADLSWDNDPSVWGYSVRYRISGTWIFDTTYTNTITLSGLYNSSLYNWQVKAMCDPNGNNSSPWTSNQTFNTITACSTPFNLAVNQIGLTSVKFVMSGPNSPDHYYVLYRASGATSWDTITLSGADISGNYATKIVTGLTSATTYEWQAQASCQADDSNLSAFAIGNNFTTLTCDAPLNPLTHTILLDRATMTWDAVADADHYEIRFKQLGSTSWQYINEYSTSRTKTNLSSATSYHWQVRTHCDASAFNISEWTDTIVFQTMTPCANTTNLSDSIVGLDFATLTWDNDPNVWAYRVRYRKTGAWIFDTTYTNTITLSGLDNSSVYNWQVKSMCDPNAVNSATWTSNHQFTTLTPCDDPSVLLVDSVGINEAYLSWTAPSGTDHFVVLYSELGSGVWNSTTTANTNIALTGLATYAPYEWSLLAFCEASGLNNSDTILGNNFVTANPCTPPTGMFSSNVLLDRFTMNWNAVALADHYEIRFKEQGSAIWQMITNITNTNNTKTNLTAGNTYEWEVRSICDASGTSYSDWSATQTQATLTPCVTPLNPASANVTLTTADLSWDNDPSVWGYSVRYRISGTWIFDTTYTNTITLSGLYNSSLYNWQVKAMCDPNGNNSSPWTSNQTFNTITACSTPFNLAVNQIGLTSVKFVMSGPNSPDHYYVLYRASGATSWDTITLSGADISGNYATKIVTGLTSATTYEWQAQASCQADDSNLSAFAIGNNFTTLIPCATPSNLASSVSGDDVTFTWDAVAGSIFYTLKYKQIGGSSGWQTISNFTNPTYIVNNLGFGISYQWIVSSSCDQSGINISAFSSPDTVSTAGCPDPQNIGVTDIQTDQVKIYWDSNPDVHHFAARARVAGTTIWTKNIQTIYGNNRTVTGLVVGTTYEFQLRSALVCLISHLFPRK